jgi:hypothetical protein
MPAPVAIAVAHPKRTKSLRFKRFSSWLQTPAPMLLGKAADVNRFNPVCPTCKKKHRDSLLKLYQCQKKGAGVNSQPLVFEICPRELRALRSDERASDRGVQDHAKMVFKLWAIIPNKKAGFAAVWSWRLFRASHNLDRHKKCAHLQTFPSPGRLKAMPRSTSSES